MQPTLKQILSFILSASFAVLASSAVAAPPATHSQLVSGGHGQAHQKAPDCKKNPNDPRCPK